VYSAASESHTCVLTTSVRPWTLFVCLLLLVCSGKVYADGPLAGEIPRITFAHPAADQVMIDDGAGRSVRTPLPVVINGSPIPEVADVGKLCPACYLAAHCRP